MLKQTAVELDAQDAPPYLVPKDWKQQTLAAAVEAKGMLHFRQSMFSQAMAGLDMDITVIKTRAAMMRVDFIVNFDSRLD